MRVEECLGGWTTRWHEVAMIADDQTCAGYLFRGKKAGVVRRVSRLTSRARPERRIRLADVRRGSHSCVVPN